LYVAKPWMVFQFEDPSKAISIAVGSPVKVIIICDET